MYQVPVDNNMQESILYSDPEFLFEPYYDDYSLLIAHTLNCHWHSDLEFDLVLRGSVTFTLDSQPFTLSAGQGIFIPANVLHTARQQNQGGPALVYGFTFRPELLTGSTSRISSYFRYNCLGFVWEVGSEATDLLSGLEGLSPDGFGYELQCLSLLSRLWLLTAMGMKERTEQPTLPSQGEEIKRLLSYIHLHYQEKITINGLISNVGISRSRCFSMFKQYTGVSPVTYLNDFRLTKASALLRETDDNITEICYACGFTDASYFIKLFREKFGVPPLQYRRR